MKIKTLTALAAVGAFAAAPVVLADDTAEDNDAVDTTEQAQAETGNQFATSSGLRAVRDKKTGKLRAPNPAELRKMAEQEAAAAADGTSAAAAAEPVITYHADGMRSATLGPEHMMSLEAKRNPDGTIEMSHTSTEKADVAESTDDESVHEDAKTPSLKPSQRSKPIMKIFKKIAAAFVGLTLSFSVFSAEIIINNVDEPGVGFNDPTPATPVGGNTGTTVGEQRLIAYARALELWGNTLASDATIVVQGSFARLNCTAGGGTLAQAGALQIFADFPNAPLAGHWYGAALANSISGFDLTPGPLDPGPLAPPFNDDILANFNGALGEADCLAGATWYYGLDNNAGPAEIDFLDTFMHEVSHGLGFQNFANEASGATPLDLPDVYMANTFDLLFGLPWNFDFGDIATSQLLVRLSATNTGNVVWTGSEVTDNASLILGPFQGCAQRAT